MVFENTKNIKNKNIFSFPNKFIVFFVFNNKKQLLKTKTKQTLIFQLFFYQTKISLIFSYKNNIFF